MVHWARKLQPHLLVYGFTLPSIAIIISELLHTGLAAWRVPPGFEPPLLQPLPDDIAIENTVGMMVILNLESIFAMLIPASQKQGSP